MTGTADDRRVVVCFVFKLNKPWLFFAVYFNININGASVDFLAFVKVGDNASLFEHLCAEASHIHKANNLVFSVAVNFFAKLKILLKSFFDSL